MRRAAVALLALPLALAACGGGGGSSSSSTTTGATPIAYVKGAAAKTSTATSEHMTLKGTLTVAGQSVILNSEGDFDNPNRRGTLHLGFNAAGLEGSIDQVIAGTTLYMRSPLFADALPKGKTWLKLDLEKAAKAQGIDFSTLGAQDPTQTLGQLQALKSVREVGTETIDGAEATHYRGRIAPTAKLKSLLPAATYGPYDIWVGKDDGYVRRVKVSFSTAANQRIVLTSSFSDFGKDVSVSVPAESETVDATNTTIQGLGG